MDPAGPADRDIDIDEATQNLPLAADSTQARVVADAVAGRSLVVEGPPGTGKSQTVSNLIFRALATGRSIMFVAEKKSALDVVARAATVERARQRAYEAVGLIRFQGEHHRTDIATWPAGLDG